MQVTITINTNGEMRFTYQDIAQALVHIAKDTDLDDTDPIRSGTGYGCYVPMDNIISASWFVEY